MAHKSNGYIYTDDAVPSLIRNGVITFYNRLERYQEQAATLVMHGGKKHERVFTESEVLAAAMSEPELPDEMPDDMWEACRSDRATMQEAMRIVVRLTRDGMLGRLLDPA